MAYRSVPGSRISPEERGAKKTVPCTRCGVMRNVDGGRKNRLTSLCRDCYGTLTPDERLLWRDKTNG